MIAEINPPHPIRASDASTLNIFSNNPHPLEEGNRSPVVLIIIKIYYFLFLVNYTYLTYFDSSAGWFLIFSNSLIVNINDLMVAIR